MPYLTDPEEQIRALKTAVNERLCFVFLTDSVCGHLFLSRLALSLVSFGIAGDADLDYGLFDHLNITNQKSRSLSFLTVPKKVIPRTEFGHLLILCGATVPLGDGDLVGLPQAAADADKLLGILQAIRDGKTFTAMDAEAN